MSSITKEESIKKIKKKVIFWFWIAFIVIAIFPIGYYIISQPPVLQIVVKLLLIDIFLIIVSLIMFFVRLSQYFIKK